MSPGRPIGSPARSDGNVGRSVGGGAFGGKVVRVVGLVALAALGSGLDPVLPHPATSVRASRAVTRRRTECSEPEMRRSGGQKRQPNGQRYRPVERLTCRNTYG